MYLFSFVFVAVCIIVVSGQENKDRERVASLIVLPPIVLGYDELYDDSTSKKAEQKKTVILRENADNMLNEKTKEVEFKETPVKSLPLEKLSATQNVAAEEKAEHVPTNLGKQPEQNKVEKDKNEIITQLQRRRSESNLSTKSNSSNNSKIEELGKKMVDEKIRNLKLQELSRMLLARKMLSRRYEDIAALKSDNNTNQSNAEGGENTEAPEEKTIQNEDVKTIQNEDVKITEEHQEHISLQGNGVITDPKLGETLNFQGKFVLPNTLFDCPCSKNKALKLF